MPETPKPGRIDTPVRLIGTKPTDESMEDEFETGEDNEQTAKTLTKLKANTQTEEQDSSAEPRKTQAGFGQYVFIAFAVMVDLTQVVLDIMLIGIIVNRITDIVVGGIFFVYAHSKGLTFREDWKIYCSIAGTVIGESIPELDMAPLFTIDAWKITSACLLYTSPSPRD